MPGSILPIEEFPEDGRVWRIEWLGAVEQTHPEAKIDVHLCEGTQVKPPSRMTGRSTTPEIARMCAKVGVGQISYLIIGSLWRNRWRLDDKAGTYQALTNLQIAADSVQLVRLDHPVGETDDGRKKWLIESPRVS